MIISTDTKEVETFFKRFDELKSSTQLTVLKKAVRAGSKPILKYQRQKAKSLFISQTGTLVKSLYVKVNKSPSSEGTAIATIGVQNLAKPKEKTRGRYKTWYASSYAVWLNYGTQEHSNSSGTSIRKKAQGKSSIKGVKATHFLDNSLTSNQEQIEKLMSDKFKEALMIAWNKL